MKPTNKTGARSLEFIRRFGAAAGRKAARYRTARQRGETVDLIDPAVARLGQEIRSLRLEKGWTRQNLAAEAGLDYTRLVLLEHGLLDKADSIEDTGRRLMMALGVAAESGGEVTQTAGPLADRLVSNAEPDTRPVQPNRADLNWAKKLLWSVDFLLLALIVWLFSPWAGEAWFTWPEVWLALAGGVIFLAGEKMAAHYWVLAGIWGDRAYVLPPGAEKEQTLRQRNRAERRFRRSIGIGGLALLLVAGPIYLPGSSVSLVKLLTAIAGAVLFSGYRILALAYWRDGVRWREKVSSLLKETELRQAVRNTENAYRLFWLCGVFAFIGAGSILLAVWSFPLVAQIVLGFAMVLLIYLGGRFVAGRYYVDIAF